MTMDATVVYKVRTTSAANLPKCDLAGCYRDAPYLVHRIGTTQTGNLCEGCRRLFRLESAEEMLRRIEAVKAVERDLS